jgi:hypothetical protein
MKAWTAVMMAIAVVTLSGCAAGETTSSESQPAAAATPAVSATTESTPAPTPPPAEPSSPAGEPEKESTPESAPAPEKAPEPESSPEKSPEGGCGAEKENVGSSCHAEDGQFCSERSCIPNFPDGNGTVVECTDGKYSHSGGLSGACSYHGGEAG